MANNSEAVKYLTAPSDEPTEPPEILTPRPARLRQKPDRLTRKSQWSNWSVLAVIVLCFFVIVYFAPSNRSGARVQAGMGKKLSQLNLQPLTGGRQPVTAADLTGRVVLLGFWATWSSPSRQQLPHLAGIGKEFADQSAFRLLAVSCGRWSRENLDALREKTQALLAQQRLDLETYADPGGLTRSAVEEVAGLKDYPTTLILDRWGRIRGVWAGYRPGIEEEMQRLISQLLAEG